MAVEIDKKNSKLIAWTQKQLFEHHQNEIDVTFQHLMVIFCYSEKSTHHACWLPAVASSGILAAHLSFSHGNFVNEILKFTQQQAFWGILNAIELYSRVTPLERVTKYVDKKL